MGLLKCKREARLPDESNAKIMDFTKGKMYQYEMNGEDYIIKDDNGNYETFFDINFMFDVVLSVND